MPDVKVADLTYTAPCPCHGVECEWVESCYETGGVFARSGDYVVDCRVDAPTTSGVPMT